MNDTVKNWLKQRLLDYAPRKYVVEFGSLDINGNIRDILPVGCKYTGIDMQRGPNVDVVTDASTWVPAIDAPPIDCVICVGVVEHTPLGVELVANAYKLLSHGGIMLFMAAYKWQEHSAIDGLPRLLPGEYYKNVTPVDLTQWCDSSFGYGNYVVTVSGADVYCVATVT